MIWATDSLPHVPGYWPMKIVTSELNNPDDGASPSFMYRTSPCCPNSETFLDIFVLPLIDGSCVAILGRSILHFTGVHNCAIFTASIYDTLRLVPENYNNLLQSTTNHSLHIKNKFTRPGGTIIIRPLTEFIIVAAGGGVGCGGQGHARGGSSGVK